MKKSGVDGLFLIAIVAGAVYELIYEPLRALVVMPVRITLKATEGILRRRKSTVGEAPSRMV